MHLQRVFGMHNGVEHRLRQCTRCRIVPEVASLKVYKSVRMGG